MPVEWKTDGIETGDICIYIMCVIEKTGLASSVAGNYGGGDTNSSAPAFMQLSLAT